MKWRAAFGAVLVAALLCATVPAGAAPQAGTGSIAGRVLDGYGNPLSGICVKVDNGSVVLSDRSGAYVITGLDSGSYDVVFTDCNAQPRFVEQWYRGFATSQGADPVLVMNGIATPLLDVTMAPGVVVTGTVTDPNGASIPDISVALNPTDPGPASTGTQTGADGTYTTVPLAPGAYKVQFVDRSANPTWASQLWNKAYSWNTADTLKLVLADGPTRAGIDGHLTAAATIAGTARSSDGTPIAGVCVDANVPNNGGYDWVGGATTGSAGEYSIGQLPATDVRIRFRNCQNGPHLEQWYQGQSDFEHSTPLLLTAGETRTGIDASLVDGIVVSGRVRDAAGDPIAGIDVNVNPTGNGSSGWGRTDASGDYTTSVLPPGTYVVEFHDSDPNPAWASQYWNGAVGRTAAMVLTLSGADGPVHAGINATLASGAVVTGKVTTVDGAPIDRICVSAEVPTSNGTDWIGGATTSSDGTYSIAGLPPTDVLVRFRDCNDVGPYVEEWWDGQGNVATATPVALAAGSTRSNVNAQLDVAGRIAGTITDRAGNPLQGMCAQATTDTFVGGMAGTNQDGRYAINLSRPGSYKVQFVDCSGAHRFAGQWWDHVTSAADARVVVVGAGQVVDHIDAALARGASGSISGKVVNLHGVAVTAACVIAYMPDQFALFAPVGADGTYTIPDVPSGTYALAFLGCRNGQPTPIVQDPQSPGTSYQGTWWKGALVDIGTRQSPDPIEQGATLVTVKPGQHLTGYDWCFGCTAIVITDITPGPGSLTVSFTTPGLLPAGVQSLAVTPAASGFTYTATCTSATGVTGSATGTSSPITVTGLTPGAAYSCTVTASDGSMSVATSAATGVVLTAAGNGAIPVAVPGAAATGTPAPAGVGAQMARTGADSAMQARFGAALLALGLALVVVARSRRSRTTPSA